MKIKGSEEADGTFGPRIKWTLRSTERNDDGEPIDVFHWTGTKVSSHKACKLTDLIIATGMIDDRENISDLDDDWDSDILLGKVIEARVDAKVGGIGFEIGDVRPAKKRSSRRDENDPFAEE